MQKEKGRPVNASDRSEREQRVYDFLDHLSIAYDRVDHEAAMTMGDCEAISEVLGVRICKNLLLCNRQQTKFYLLMMPDQKPFKTKEISRQIQSARLSFASSDVMERFLDTLPGSLSVLGLMNDHDHQVRLLIDEDLLKDAYVGVHPCQNTSSLAISMRDLQDVILPAMGHEPTFVHLIGE